MRRRWGQEPYNPLESHIWDTPLRGLPGVPWFGTMGNRVGFEDSFIGAARWCGQAQSPRRLQCLMPGPVGEE